MANIYNAEAKQLSSIIFSTTCLHKWQKTLINAMFFVLPPEER